VEKLVCGLLKPPKVITFCIYLGFEPFPLSVEEVVQIGFVVSLLYRDDYGRVLGYVDISLSVEVIVVVWLSAHPSKYSGDSSCTLPLV